MSENWPPTEEPKAEEPEVTGQPADASPSDLPSASSESAAAADSATPPFPSTWVPAAPEAPEGHASASTPPGQEPFSGPPTLGDHYPTHQYPAQPAPAGPPAPRDHRPHRQLNRFRSPPIRPPGPMPRPVSTRGSGSISAATTPLPATIRPARRFRRQVVGPRRPHPLGARHRVRHPRPEAGAVPARPPADGPTPATARLRRLDRPDTADSGIIAVAVALVLAVAILAGVGVGHLVWTNQSAANPGLSAPNGSGSTGNGTSPFGGGSSQFGGGSNSSGSGSTGNSSTGAGAPSDISAIATKVDPGIVDINTNLSYQNEQAAGTGMVLTSNGEILTNNHVIDGATSISVTDVGNGKTYTASVVGYNRTQDVAVLQLQGASGLQTVKTTSQTPSIGQAIVGVGNAGGAGGTPSTAGGSVTALGQSITASDSGGGNAENLSGLIEINAPIEPGDSGGPLVNASSEVMGMDTAASSSQGFGVSGGSQAYTIPITTALSIARQIEAGQSSSTLHIGATAFLGVEVQPSSSSSSSGSSGGSGGSGSSGGLGGLGIGSGNSGSATSGAVVDGVVAGGAAAQAGLAQGDVITSFNGHTINDSSDLSNLMVSEHPGDTVQLQWTDSSGQTHSASVKLASGPPT